MHIGGNNAGVPPDVDSSYFFSWLTRTGGWATWRDAWKEMDSDLASWPDMKADGILNDVMVTDDMMSAHEEMFDTLHRGERNNWDGIWQYTVLANGGMAALPAANLVKHIGYGPAAQHNTETPYLMRLQLPDSNRMAFPLVHPDDLSMNPAFEHELYRYKRGWKTRYFRKIDRTINRLL